VLHGEATGIPLHIIYTDLPLGAWWMAQFLDLFPDDGMRRASTRLVGLGVVAAVPTALTGRAGGRGRTAAPGGWGSSTPRRTAFRRSSSSVRGRLGHAVATIWASGSAGWEAWSSSSGPCAVGTCAATARPYPTPTMPARWQQPKQGKRQQRCTE
jgi:hypothetical protein